MNGEDSALKPTSHQAEEDQRLAERERAPPELRGEAKDARGDRV